VIRPDISLKMNSSYKTRYDKWNTLLDELNRKRHVLPIKKLFEKYEGIMLRIAPCWLATPSAVSSIFPLKRNIFDYIIFDEASQSRVAQSLAALYRGKKIVIIGDEKQLPPISHFSKDDDEEIINDEIDRELLSESLLELANRTFNHTYLRWHYRAIHQELVDFSNYAFYDGLLKIVPNISKPSVPPIKWISCNNGRWVNRSNKPEAELVVNELKTILMDNRRTGVNRSVGIITFNTPQKEEIWDEIERRKQKDSEFKELYAATDDQGKHAIRDLPFVRNIENVQGEERDIIIFSLGYAKDFVTPDETFGIHFGSLNGLNGENYLNVAITRARQEIIIVCSFDPDKINVDHATHTGPRRLKEYLCYAKSISESNHQETVSILSSLSINESNNTSLLYEEDDLETLVKTELEKLGYRVDLHTGNSNYKIDMAVVHPDNPSMYILAIECDGNFFQSAESTKERDITRQEFLESRGWAVEHIWSRNWWKDSNREITRIRDKIEELRKIRLPTSFVVHPTEVILDEKVSDTSTVDEETIIDRIKKRESSDIELKSSFRYDIINRKPNPKMEKIIAKTISAFMNAEGGTLYIGVDDENNVIGLQEDYQTLKKQNSDGFEIEFRQAIEKYTKNKVANEYLKIRFHPVDNKEICEVVIAPSPRPVFVYDEGKQECFVRVGNSSKPYDLDEFYEYSKRRFK
jgi:very-short-patch-repair endonuclease